VQNRVTVPQATSDDAPKAQAAVHVTTPASDPHLQRPDMTAPLQCILGNEDDWVAVDPETRLALERHGRILREESRKEQKLDEYDMPNDYNGSCGESEDTCGSGGGGGGGGSDSYGGRSKVFISQFQKSDWEAIPDEESALLSFDCPSFAPLQVLQRQQESRRGILLQENATRIAREHMKVELQERVQELAANKSSAAPPPGVQSEYRAKPPLVPHPSDALAAKVDYAEVFKTYLANYREHLQALLPTIASSFDESPPVSTNPTVVTDLADVPSTGKEKNFSTPDYLIARNVHNFSEDLVACEHVTTQTDIVPAGVQGLLQAVDPLQLPSKAVKLLCFMEPRLGLVLASVPRAQGGDQMKTIVRAKIGEHIDAELAKYVNIGDELVSISGFDMATLPYSQQVQTIATSKRPIVLGFVSSN